jgi:hypothetical protein
MEQAVRVPINNETLDRLRRLALDERRTPADQAAILLERAVCRAASPQAERRTQAAER